TLGGGREPGPANLDASVVWRDVEVAGGANGLARRLVEDGERQLYTCRALFERARDPRRDGSEGIAGIRGHEAPDSGVLTAGIEANGVLWSQRLDARHGSLQCDRCDLKWHWLVSLYLLGSLI